MNKELKEVIASMKSDEFKNEHGEKFVLYSNGITVLMSGDEVNAMVDNEHKVDGVMPLFNEHFNVWSAAELYMLGNAMAGLAEEYMSREDYEFIHSITENSVAV